MSLVAPTLEAFFTSRLIGERQASPRTVAAYRDTFCLLVRFAARTTSQEPSRLDFSHLDAPLVGAFLAYLEQERGNGVRTRRRHPGRHLAPGPPPRTAALERFTGYTGQSRSQHATHTWNVTRLPDLDHGGILADDRTPDREVLDALRRVPDTGFATHDNPARIRALIAERDEHRTVLGSAPPDQRRELDRAQRELHSANDEHHWAKYRLDAAHDRLDRIGSLSLLSRKGRQQKTSASQDIERFQGDVGRATDNLDACEARLAQLADAVAHGDEWHAQNSWRHQRLVSIERELTDLGHIDLRTVPLPGSQPDQRRDLNPANGLTQRFSRALGQPRANDASEWWAHRHPKIASPPLPGHDSGLGMDIGF